MAVETDHVRQRGDGEDASQAVLQTVSAASDLSLRELPPLQESIDVESLDRLFDSSRSVEAVTFEYAGYEVSFDGERVKVSQK